MPELPEVHTTVLGLRKVIITKTIQDVWSDFHLKTAHQERRTIKNKNYFDKFKRLVKRAKIKSVERRGKNILINLNNAYTIVVHMKMTGHLIYGKYKQSKVKSRKVYKVEWVAIEDGPLKDPYNKFIHLVFSLSNRKHLVLSDMRKFASVTISKTEELAQHDSVGVLGPEPLSPNFTAKKLFEKLNKVPNWPIKSALLNQELLAGIGNIYSDEILWETAVHPLSPVKMVPKKKFGEIFKVMRKILKFSISKGGDSKSDYRNVFGEKGSFQNFHKVYGQRKKRCPHKKCRDKIGAIIERVVVKGRSAHFCPVHQIKYERK